MWMSKISIQLIIEYMLVDLSHVSVFLVNCSYSKMTIKFRWLASYWELEMLKYCRTRQKISKSFSFGKKWSAIISWSINDFEKWRQRQVKIWDQVAWPSWLKLPPVLRFLRSSYIGPVSQRVDFSILVTVNSSCISKNIRFLEQHHRTNGIFTNADHWCCYDVKKTSLKK